MLLVLGAAGACGGDYKILETAAPGPARERNYIPGKADSSGAVLRGAGSVLSARAF